MIVLIYLSNVFVLQIEYICIDINLNGILVVRSLGKF